MYGDINESGGRSRACKPSRSRGRIAEVLAGARATIQEPSRPVTPASLDARVDHIPESDSYFHSAPKSNTSSFLYANILSSSSHEPSRSSNTSKPILTHSSSGTDISLLLLDISDNLTLIETCLHSVTVDASYLSTALHNMTQSVDKFAKYMKSVSFSDNTVLYNRLVEVLCHILDSTQSRAVRQQTCRHILRLHLAKYPVDVQLLSPDDARILLRTTRDLYLSVNDDTPSAGEEEAGVNADDDVMVRGGIDLILELLGVVWTQVKGGMGVLPGKSARRETLPQNAGMSLKMFLEAGVHAAGVMRCYSKKDTNRKRLGHIGAMSTLSDGLKAVIRVYSAHRKQVAKTARGVDAASNSLSRDESVTLSQLGYIMVQVVGTIRNFALDSVGRQQMLSNYTICHLCDLLNLFETNHELCLNCVRVTAKISLLEPFRSQLNTDPRYIAAITQVILNEAEMCLRVMNGDDEISWPSWHTWPLLSRAAFSLGNMTTTNDANRLLIANTCRCLRPLIVILQTCGCSLMHLYSTSSMDDDDSEGTSERDDVFSSRERSSDHGSDDEGDDGGLAEQELGDATVKLIRLFANLSINESIGKTLAKRRDSTKMLLELLACSEVGRNHDELQLNVVAACTNLTFYSCQMDTVASPRGSPDSATDTTKDLQSMATRLSNYLFHDNPEVVLEAARALGNLTRCDAVIQTLCVTRATEALVLLLSHSDFEILLAVTGALINVSANPQALSCLTDSERPAQNLAAVLRRSSFKHLPLTTLVCQVFHNLLLHGNNFDKVVNDALGDSLAELLDCAEDFEGTEKYSQFISVGKLVMAYLKECR